MTNEQILKKVIEKADKCGYKWEGNIETSVDELAFITANRPYLFNAMTQYIIFSHDFAKAFWGEKESMIEGHCEGIIKEGWQYHLQQMVLEEEPLKYIERFLD